jgi:hypothetical protein
MMGSFVEFVLRQAQDDGGRKSNQKILPHYSIILSLSKDELADD